MVHSGSGDQVDTGSLCLAASGPWFSMEHAAVGDTVHVESVLPLPGNSHFLLHHSSFVLKVWLILEVTAISMFSFKIMFTTS